MLIEGELKSYIIDKVEDLDEYLLELRKLQGDPRAEADIDLLLDRRLEMTCNT